MIKSHLKLVLISWVKIQKMIFFIDMEWKYDLFFFIFFLNLYL